MGSFAANITVGGGVLAAAVIATGSALQAFAIATLVARQLGAPRRFQRMRDVLIFVGFATVGSIIAPTVALLPLATLYPLNAPDLAWNWWTWWQGDACGMLIFTPLILSWSAPGMTWTLRKAAEAALYTALLVAATVLVFSAGFGRSFVLLPFIIWAAFRFGQREVTTASAVVCAMALWYTLHGDVGPFAQIPLNESLLLLLVFVTTVMVTGLMLSAVLSQLEAAMLALRTRQARTESMLSEAERRFRLMVESVVDYAIVMLDAEGRVTTWNAGAERILGYGADEIIGQHFLRFYPRDSLERGKTQLALEIAAAGGRFEEEGWRVRRDGSTFWASVVVTGVRDDTGRLLGFAKLVRDLTERNSAEAELIRAKVTAERASEAKSQFLANMSHELRTPLNSLLILARLLADNKGANLTAKQVQFAQTIHASGIDLLSLINDLLDLAKIESGAVTALNVAPARFAELSEEIERGFRQVAQDRKLGFRIVVEPGLPETIRTDAARLKQVLKNLLANAFKFTREGEVKLVIAPLAPASVAFSVVDTGIGVAPDKQQIIFEAFQQADGTTSRQYGGTGLGLSISRELTRLLGGELRLSSTPGQGSTFTLVLPISDQRTTQAA